MYLSILPVLMNGPLLAKANPMKGTFPASFLNKAMPHASLLCVNLVLVFNTPQPFSFSPAAELVDQNSTGLLPWC